MARKKTSRQFPPLLWLSIFVAGCITLVYLFLSLKPYSYSQAPLVPDNLLGHYDTTDTRGTFEGREVASAKGQEVALQAGVLGDTTSNKRIEVDLSNQRLYAFEGDRKVFDFLVSTGKFNRTPTGEFKIWIKLRYTKMSGGSKALGTYYYLPNVPYTMFFANASYPAHLGYGIHGTYWHNNFGHPMSHGCINMKTEEVEQLYYWAHPTGDKGTIKATADNPGTKIIIYGKAPPS